VENDIVSNPSIQQFDEAKYGQPHAILGALVMYRTAKQTQSGEHVKLWSEVEPSLIRIEGDNRDMHRLSNIVIHYSGVRVSLENVFDHLHSIFSKHKVLFTAGVTGENDIIVFMKKTCYKQVPDLSITDVQPSIYKVPVRLKSSEDVQSLLKDVDKCMGNTVSNMRIVPPYGTFSFEQFLANARELSASQLATMKGNIELVQCKHRTDFQHTLLRVHYTLCRVVELEK
jgi:hypothetical protein